MLQRYFETNNSLSPARGSYSEQLKKKIAELEVCPPHESAIL